MQVNQGDDFLVEGSLDQSFYSTEEKVYTKGDLHRIGLMKLAADHVFNYFTTLMEDHRIILNDKDHQKHVEALVETLIGVFGIPPNQCELVKYFAANVITSAQLYESVTADTKAWLPFTDEAIGNFFLATEVQSILEGKTAQEAGMYAGIFISESTKTHPKIQEIYEAKVTGSDLLFVQTHCADLLISNASLEVQQDAEDDLMGTIGEIMTTTPMGLFGDDFKAV